MPKDIVASNNNIFRDLRTKLEDGRRQLFENAVSQLAEWLKSDRAYYAEAKPQIIDLIEVFDDRR
ncbi:hypothetical protein EIP91_009302 [Steccherinum ochraceum]|uniref:Uncharacterized protein n=1 Tax=Steccherinum ochraceum TaxID=92696 RepID=A0A4R0R1S9_9APHY|nr:hypothetical protein EIP91_009302 [Steccherinum ochraceum]